MDASLEKLLSQVLELEGLLLVAEKKQDETPSIVYEMIRQKATAIGAYTTDASVTASPVAEPEPTEQPQFESIDSLPDDEPDDDITVEFVDEPDDAESTPAEATPEPKPEVTEPAAEPEPEETFVETTQIVYDEVQPADVELIDEPEAEQTAQTTLSFDEEETPAPADDNDEDVDDEHAYDEDEDEMTLDEALQRNLSKNLRNAFSLNDRYRYRRELFSNSDAVMKETLDLIDTMGSFDEAEDYFYNTLDWDHESPEVSDFMVVIKNYFWNKRQQTL